MPKGQMWTTDEIRLLKAMYAKHGGNISEWEFKLDRTDNAIHVQARRLGLCKVKSHTGMSTSQRNRLLKGFQEICKHLHLNPKTALIELNRMRERGMI